MAREIIRDEDQPSLFDLNSLNLEPKRFVKKEDRPGITEPTFKIRSPRQKGRLSGEGRILRELDQERD